MNLDDPQLQGGGAESNVAPPTSAFDAFTAAAHQALLHTSMPMLGDYLLDRKGNDDAVLSKDAYANSIYSRDGGFHDGITVAQARVYAAKADAARSQKDAQAMAGHDWAARAGGLVGGAMDPLFYIPYIDELAPELKAAMIAKRGEVIGTAGTQSVNAMIAASAEQPLAASYANKHGEDFDLGDAATNIAFAGAAGGTFGGLGAKLNLMFPQKVAGIAKTLDDVNMGRQVDAADIVQPKPDYTSQVQASLRAGVTPTDIDPVDLDPISRRAVNLSKKASAPAEGIFHGTSRDIDSLEEGHYESRNIYGQGFYTTDSFRTASGYTNKGGGSQPTIYRVTPSDGAKLYDMESPLTDEIREDVKKSGMGNELPTGFLSEAKTLREVLDEFRDSSSGNMMSRDTVQEYMYSLSERLEDKGYAGYTHTGGNKTGNSPHKVRIFFRPERDVKISKFDPLTSDERAFLESYKTDRGASYFRSKIDELDRRTEEGAEARKRYDDMTDAERRQSHFTDELTGIPNARAYAENPRMPIQVRTDMDNFKEVNDTLGHDTGDVAIKKAAQIMHEEFRKVGGVAYRASHAGDEFPAEAPSQAAADKAIAAARERMESLKIEATGPDGTIYRKKGLGISYGSGNTTSAAEASLLADKGARTQAGLRRSAGQSDLERVAPDAAGGKQDNVGDRAGKLAYYREQLAAAEHPGVKWDAAGPATPKPEAPAGAKAEPEEPDLSGLPLTEADKTHLAKVDENASKLEGMARALKAGAACFGLE